MTTLDPKKLIEKVDLNIIDRHSIPNSSYSSFNILIVRKLVFHSGFVDIQSIHARRNNYSIFQLTLLRPLCLGDKNDLPEYSDAVCLSL